MIWLLLVLQLALPNPALTPGVVRPMTHTEVCTTRWGLDVRHVTRRMRQTVFRWYGVSWDARANYTVDHLVPRQLAGADDLRNLWPQPKDEARFWKDRDENRLQKQVCAGQLSLKDAQAQMRQWGR